MATLAIQQQDSVFTDEGNMIDIVNVLIAYMRENLLFVEQGMVEVLTSDDHGLVRYSDNLVEIHDRSVFSSFRIER